MGVTFFHTSLLSLFILGGGSFCVSIAREALLLWGGGERIQGRGMMNGDRKLDKWKVQREK